MPTFEPLSTGPRTVIASHNWLASRWLRLLLSAGAVVAAVLAGWTYTSRAAVPDGYIQTTGYFAAQISGSGPQTDDTIIVFRDGDGREFRFTSDTSGPEGDQVKVAFDPADPESTAGTADDRRGLVWYVPAATAAVLAFAAAVLFVMTRDFGAGGSPPRSSLGVIDPQGAGRRWFSGDDSTRP